MMALLASGLLRLRHLFILAMLGVLTACSTPTVAPVQPSPATAFLADAEEKVYSPLLERDQRVLLQIELVDTVRPRQRRQSGNESGYAIPAGTHRVQFRVLLPSTGWQDSGAREARGFFDVTLAAGHRYRVAGRYEQGKRLFHLLDTTTNQAVSPEVDLGFFAPVQRNGQYIPIIIPIKT